MRAIETTANGMSATARDYAELIRPEQWVKNVVVFAGPAAGLAFTSADALPNLLSTLLTFTIFCLAASAGYAFNDIVDRRADANHPIKRNRPVASGRVSPGGAALLSSLLAGTALLISALWLPRGVTTVLVAYMGMVTLYTLSLKRRVILDVIIIATGFVLRAFAGALAVGVPTSDWLIACVFTLCLFMGFGKRRCEIAMIGSTEDQLEYRKTLVRYTPDLLNHLITVSAGIAIITFLLYTLDDTHPSPLPKEQLFFTLPLVVYGIFRFAMISELGRYAGPTEIVLKDRALLWTVILWTACAMVVAYQNVLFGPDGLKRFLGGD